MTLEYWLKSALCISIIIEACFPALFARAADHSKARVQQQEQTFRKPGERFELDSETIGQTDPDENPGGKFFDWRRSYETAQTAAIQNDFQLADQMYEQSLRLAESISPDNERVATCKYKLGAMRRLRGDSQSAQQLLCAAIDFKKYGLWSQHPTILAAQSELAALYSSENDPSKADQLLQQQLKSAQESGASPLVIATILNKRAALFIDRGNFKKAMPILDQILIIQQNSFPATDPNVAIVIQKAALLYDLNNFHYESERLFKRAIAIYSKAGRKYNNHLTACKNNLIEVLLRQAKWSEALSTAEELSKAGPPPGLEQTTLTRTLAKAYLTCGKSTGDKANLAKALSLFQSIDAATAASIRRSDLTSAVDLQLLGEAYLCNDKLEAGKKYLTRAIAIQQEFPNQSEPIADLWMLLAGSYCRNKQFTDAETYYKKALSVVLTAPGNHTEKLAEVCDSWGFLYNWQGKYDEALPLAKKALTLADSHYSPNQQVMLRYLGHYAVDLAALKRFAEAAPFFRRALKIAERTGDYDACPTSFWAPFYLEALRALDLDNELEDVRVRIARIQSKTADKITH